MNPALKWLAFAGIVLLASEASAACGVTATDVNFGNYDIFDPAPLTSTGTVTVNCDEAPPPDVTISIEPSMHSGLFNPRQMKLTTGADRLTYNLYTDAGRTSIWGDGAGGTSVVILKNVTKNKPRTATIYGSLPPRQNISAGVYGDLLTVTILW
ncbi:MAG: spore coat U domain-containing protein [Nitrospirota bacterium]